MKFVYMHVINVNKYSIFLVLKFTVPNFSELQNSRSHAFNISVCKNSKFIFPITILITILMALYEKLAFKMGEHTALSL